MGGCPGAFDRSRIKTKAEAWTKRRLGSANSTEKNTARAVKKSRHVWKSHGLPRAAARAGQRAGRHIPVWNTCQGARLHGRSDAERVPRLRGKAPDRSGALAARAHRI